MTIKEMLQEERDNYWDNKINFAIRYISGYLKEKQKLTKYIENNYCIKICAKIDGGDVLISLKREEMEEDADLDLLETDEEVKEYLHRLKTRLYFEGFRKVDWDYAFSKDKLAESERIVIEAAFYEN